MNISEKIRYIGVNDRDIDLFESQYVVPNGVSYNSYLILDEKIAVMDTADARMEKQWFGNLEKELCGRTPDYLVVSHMEPDHAALIGRFLSKYPDAQIVGNAKTFPMMTQFFDVAPEDKKLLVAEGDELSLGEHTLAFYMAPMVHWPEVMVTYEKKEKVLFSADGFGKFGALDTDEDWACEARRYYFNIVGKYGAQVQALLKKAAGLDIAVIAPLHGPVLTENLAYYMDKYRIWSSYEPEDTGVFIAYASIYGNTAKAAGILKEELEKAGVEKVSICDLAREDMAEAVEDAFRYDRLVLAAATYDGGVFTRMDEFLHHLKAKNFQKRKVALIENGTWAPMAAKQMRTVLETMKEIEIAEPVVTIRSSVNEKNREQIRELAAKLKNWR